MVSFKRCLDYYERVYRDGASAQRLMLEKEELIEKLLQEEIFEQPYDIWFRGPLMVVATSVDELYLIQ